MTDYTTHPDYRAMLAGIRADPADDLKRLVLADWLDEHGQPERAELIRVQCRIAEIRRYCMCGGCRKSGQHHNGPCGIDRERVELPDGTSRQAFLRVRNTRLAESLFASVLSPAALAGCSWDRHRRPADPRPRLPTVLRPGNSTEGGEVMKLRHPTPAETRGALRQSHGWLKNNGIIDAFHCSVCGMTRHPHQYAGGMGMIGVAGMVFVCVRCYDEEFPPSEVK